jgi:hypothetical protein
MDRAAVARREAHVDERVGGGLDVPLMLLKGRGQPQRVVVLRGRAGYELEQHPPLNLELDAAGRGGARRNVRARVILFRS